MVTEVTTQGYFSRIMESIKGILVGMLLVLGCGIGLFWNEGRAVTTARTLEEVGGNVVTASIDAVDPAQEGKLIHVTGGATSKETLKDELGVSAENVISLCRKVEMYQWKEEKKTKKRSQTGGSEVTETTYTYEKTWDEDTIPSGSFKERGHDNPSSMPFTSATVTASTVTIGARRLTPELVKQIPPNEPYPVGTATPASTGGKTVRPNNGGWYLGNDPASPQVGDLRVSFSVARPQNVSIIAAQAGPTFAPWLAPGTGQTWSRLDLGTYTAQQMVQSAEHENAVMTWIIRGVGCFLMIMGFAMIFRPLVVVADVLPILGSIAGLGTGIAAFGLGAAGSLLTIGVAWIFYRPLIGVPLVALAVVGIVLLFVKGSGAKKATA